MYLLKQNVLEKGNESEPLRAIALLEGILETLQPGGAAEMQSLQAFVRNLRPVCSAKEGLSVLRRWRLARSRAIALALPQVLTCGVYFLSQRLVFIHKTGQSATMGVHSLLKPVQVIH